ncbi:hypothetical protein FCM35_KLT02358 [Carex littledalei]|uniref:Uncharacterized protein n=1 Tax=Carex littledalei TaxID=544730 RepID=A0A833RAQ0_9POAL|nr:hypothetical protein FCM35_KLT02358 [Carex littledalei]
MSINKLFADMGMDLDIVDLSEDESTEKTGVKPKDGTVVINCDQNETETNNGERKINVQNEEQAKINWNLLEMESDKEEVQTQKDSQGSDNSVLLLEDGYDSLVLSSREEDLGMNENDSLDLDMREKGDDNLKGVNQINVVSSIESRVGSENMMVQLTLDSEDNKLKYENEEGLNDNVDLDLNASENLVFSLGVDGDHLKRLSENGAIRDAENKDMFPEKKEGFVLVSADNMEMGNENMQVLNKNGDLDLDKNQRVGLDSGIGNNFDAVIETSSVTDMEKRGESEKMEVQLVLVSEHEATEIEYMEGLKENSALGTCANNNLCLGPGEVNDNLKGSGGSSVVSSIESKDNSEKMDLGTILAENDEKMENEDMEGVVSSIGSKGNSEKMDLGIVLAETGEEMEDENKEGANANVDFVLKEGVNSEILINDGEMGFTQNKDKIQEMEGVIANSSAVRCDSEMNSLELVLDTSVQGTIVDASKGTETQMDQTVKRGESEKMELQLVSVSGHEVTEIEHMEGLKENSASGTCANNNLKGASANVDFVLKEGFSSEVLLKDGEMGFTENRGKVEQVDHEKLNLEGVIENRSIVRGNSEMNSLELVLDTSVQGTIVDASKGIETQMDQTEIIEPSMDNANLNSGPSKKVDQTMSNNEPETADLGSSLGSFLDSKTPKRRGRKAKGKPNDANTKVDQTMSNNEPETADLGSSLGSFLDSKSPKRRGRKAKGKPNDANTNLESVVCHTGEGSSSRGKRERKESKYLSHPYTSVESSQKKLKRDQITNGEDEKVNNGEGKKVKTGDDVKEVYKGNDGKSEMFSENVVLDLISTAQGPLNPQNSILTKPTTGLLTAFHDSVSGNVKISQEICPMISGPTANVLNSETEERHQGYIYDEPAALLVKFHSSANIPSKEDLIVKFTKFGALVDPVTHLVTDGESARIVFARLNDALVAFDCFNRSGDFETTRLRYVSPIKVAIAPPPVLLDARDKLEEMIMSFNGSGLENKESLMEDARGLLEKVNLTLTKNGTIRY